MDLLIRTSGEMRTSNFLPWQLVYAEMVFTNVYWPDFTRDEYLKCLHIYAERDRRFGGVKDEAADDEPAAATPESEQTPEPGAEPEQAAEPTPEPEPEAASEPMAEPESEPDAEAPSEPLEEDEEETLC